MTYTSPRLFALVIGIDKYKDPNIRRLSGAVADAEAVCEFLCSRVHVPDERIVIMRNEQATKRAMISAFERLASETIIGVKDPILIYYAGHGGQAEPPAQLKHSLGSKIEMLLPYDFNSMGSTTSEGQGLFDLKLSSLLADIAESKSDNIVSPLFHPSFLLRIYLTRDRPLYWIAVTWAQGPEAPVQFAVLNYLRTILFPLTC